MDEVIHCLKIVPIFAGLSDEELDQIAEISTARNYGRGESIYMAGDQGGRLLVLHTGRVKVYRISAAGKEQVLRLAGPGDFIGELSLFSALPLSDYATATEASTMCMLEGNRLKELMLSSPAIALKVMDVLSQRLAGADQMLEAISLSSVGQRLAQALIEQANIKGHVTLKASKGDFASQLGMSQETLSRKLTQWQDEGLIALSGQRGINILDMAALEDMRDGEE